MAAVNGMKMFAGKEKYFSDRDSIYIPHSPVFWQNVISSKSVSIKPRVRQTQNQTMGR